MIVSSNFPTTSSVTLRLNYQIWNERFAWQVVFYNKANNTCVTFPSSCNLTDRDLCGLKFKKVICVAPEMT